MVKWFAYLLSLQPPASYPGRAMCYLAFLDWIALEFALITIARNSDSP
jgi:hypothetical protein